jgi:hypothetical protein
LNSVQLQRAEPPGGAWQVVRPMSLHGVVVSLPFAQI